MLKLIYSLSGKEITLKFNKKRLFWTKELLIALSLSFGVHFLAFSLFHIKALKPLHEIVLQPGAVTSEVRMDVSSPKRIQVDEVFPKNFPSLSESRLSMNHPLTLGDDKLFSSQGDPFYQMEKGEEFIAPPLVRLYKEIKPIQIDVSDSLKDRCEGIRVKSKKILIGSTETLHLKFKIEVEDRTGKIFHTEQLISSGSSKYDHYGLSLLKNIQFEKRVGQFTTHGELDLLIEADSRDIYD